jgi:hypothetical protein
MKAHSIVTDGFGRGARLGGRERVFERGELEAAERLVQERRLACLLEQIEVRLPEGAQQRRVGRSPARGLGDLPRRLRISGRHVDGDGAGVGCELRLGRAPQADGELERLERLLAPTAPAQRMRELDEKPGLRVTAGGAADHEGGYRLAPIRA